MKTIDLEIGMMGKLDYVTNLIVPNVTELSCLLRFEADLLMLTKSGYATGIELKVSKADLRKDLKKKHINRLGTFHRPEYSGVSSWKEFYFGKFKHFYYAVPEELEEAALEQIPDFCGLYVAKEREGGGYPSIIKVRNADVLYKYKWNDAEKFDVARLGAMRILGLKASVSRYRKELSNELKKKS